MTAEPDVAGTDSTSSRTARATVSRQAGLLRLVGLNVAGPLLVYRLAREGGLAVTWSLVLSGLPPGAGVLVDWLRLRTLEVVGAIVIGEIGLSIALALVSSNPHWILLEGAATTAGFGLLCLASTRRRRPLLFFFAQAFMGGRHSAAGAEMDETFERYADARRFWRIVTRVWGGAYVLEAVGLAIVVELATSGQALAANRITPWVVFAVLFIWTRTWGARLQR
jgi:hypothetical protein